MFLNLTNIRIFSISLGRLAAISQAKDREIISASVPRLPAFWAISSPKGGISFLPHTRSVRYSQKETPSLRQVFFKLAKVSRHLRPSSLRVLPLIFRFVTNSRISCSLALLWIGKSGLDKTLSNSLFRLQSRPRT